MRLLGQRFFDGSRFFRVIPGFVAQYGVSGHANLERHWAKWRIRDDPRKPGVHNAQTGKRNKKATSMTKPMDQFDESIR